MVIKIKNKKGAAHVEIILSFAIFIGFLIFLIVVFKPFQFRGGGDVYLDTLERGISSYAAVEVNSFAIRLNQSSTGCFWFEDSSTNVSARNMSNAPVDAKSENGKVYINGQGDFFYIYSSPAFSETAFDLTACMEKANYTLGLTRSISALSDAKLEELKSRVENDYAALKTELSLPASKEFTFGVRSTQDELILTVSKNIPKGVNVFARNIPVQVAYENRTLVYAILNIQTW